MGSSGWLYLAPCFCLGTPGTHSALAVTHPHHSLKQPQEATGVVPIPVCPEQRGQQQREAPGWLQVSFLLFSRGNPGSQPLPYLAHPAPIRAHQQLRAEVPGMAPCQPADRNPLGKEAGHKRMLGLAAFPTLAWKRAWKKQSCFRAVSSLLCLKRILQGIENKPFMKCSPRFFQKVCLALLY